MSTLAIEIQAAKARQVTVMDDSLTDDLDDRRTISAPLGWYPRLLHGTPEERNHRLATAYRPDHEEWGVNLLCRRRKP